MPFLSHVLPMRRPAFSNDILALYPTKLETPEPELGIHDTFVFRICKKDNYKEIGQITLRVGEGWGMFYFGHIGYHINAPYRGHHYALEACRMLVPLMQVLHFKSLVITTDETNAASRRTCEKLGCVLESTVDVPRRLQQEYQLSDRKLRYIYRVPED